MNACGCSNLLKTKARFDAFWVPEPMSGCWLWTGGGSTKGYGRFYINKQDEYAHRAAWQIYRGPIPEGQCVLHKCDVRVCVNPDHLWLGSIAENNADARRKGRSVNVTGDDHGSTKISDLRVSWLRNLRWRRKLTYRELGRMFGIAPSTALQICSGYRRGRVRDLWQSITYAVSPVWVGVTLSL